MDSRPIGVFDSGLGGLTVLKELKNKLQNESFVYLGDTARVPYGNRSKEIITEFSLQDSKFLIKKNVKCVVVACNTASSVAMEDLCKSADIPFFNVVKAGSLAASKATKNKLVGVIATRATVNSGAYERSIKGLDPLIRLKQISAPLLVPLIEEGEVDPKIINIFLEKYLRPLKQSDIDTLVLGCTHYPIIAKDISGYLEGKVNVVNPAAMLSDEIAEFLKKNDQESGDRDRSITYYVTDLNDNFIRIAEIFLDEKLDGKLNKVELK